MVNPESSARGPELGTGRAQIRQRELSRVPWAAARPPAKGLPACSIMPASQVQRATGTEDQPLSTHTPGRGTALAAPHNGHATNQRPQDDPARLNLRVAVFRVVPEGQALGEKKPCHLCTLSLGGNAPLRFQTSLIGSQDWEQI